MRLEAGILVNLGALLQHQYQINLFFVGVFDLKQYLGRID
jgi:hypothetical protein